MKFWCLLYCGYSDFQDFRQNLSNFRTFSGLWSRFHFSGLFQDFSWLFRWYPPCSLQIRWIWVECTTQKKIMLLYSSASVLCHKSWLICAIKTWTSCIFYISCKHIWSGNAVFTQSQNSYVYFSKILKLLHYIQQSFFHIFL